MMNSNMNKILSYVGAIGAAILAMVMIFLEVINQDIPALVWLAFSAFMAAYVIAEKTIRKPR